MPCQFGEPEVYTNPLHFTDEETGVKLEKLSFSPSITLWVKGRAESELPVLNSANPGMGEKNLIDRAGPREYWVVY